MKTPLPMNVSATYLPVLCHQDIKINDIRESFTINAPSLPIQPMSSCAMKLSLCGRMYGVCYCCYVTACHCYTQPTQQLGIQINIRKQEEIYCNHILFCTHPFLPVYCNSNDPKYSNKCWLQHG